MGFFSKFGGQKEYPALGPGSPAAEQLANIQGCLENLVEEIPDRLEVIPDEGTAFVFIGKPPKKFGIAWIKNGQVKNLHSVAKEKGIQPMVLQGISEELRAAYEKNQNTDRFSTVIAGKSIVVTPCDSLKSEVANIVEKIVN